MPTRFSILFLGPADQRSHVANSLGSRFGIEHAVTDADVDRLLPSCDVILDAYMRIRFPAGRLAKASRLRLFVTATTGADHVDAAALAARNIPLLTLKGQREILKNITPAAEHSWLLLMACARRLRAAIQEPLDGAWDRNKFPGILLRGKTLGIIGCGRIGEWMSVYATAFGMRCVGHDPHVEPWPATVERVPLDVLLAASDFVTVHVPLNDETRNLLGPKQLAALKPGAVLVNTSRGEVIDEASLLQALEKGTIAAAGLDVLKGEPEVGRHPLVEYARTHPQLIITPHIGGFSPDALRYVLDFSCKRILEFFGSGS